MTRANPANPYTRDSEHTSKDVQMPISKARVVSVNDSDNGGVHTIEVSVYNSDVEEEAPVLTPMTGCVWLPQEGDDVAVLFSKEGKPWVVGAWYAVDRLDSGNVELPSYDAGDLRLGNKSGSHVTIKENGDIQIESADGSDVLINGVVQ